jgi:3-carboxy-cis,cis-muconate cycloisomerase
LASLGPVGEEVQRRLMAELGLGVPAIAWHAARDGFAELACVLGMVCATCGKFGQEVALLMRTEVQELAEGFVPGRGACSTMPQKRNPITSELLIAIARIARQDVALALDAMTPDHERATGPWHLEWECLPELCGLAGGALRHALDLVTRLTVRPERMAANLALTGGLIVAEAVMMALAPKLGRQRAHDVVYAACAEALASGRPLAEILGGHVEVTAVLTPEEIGVALDPRRYTGWAAAFVDRVAGAEPGARLEAR